MYNNLYIVAMASKCFVDSIIQNLKNHMVQTRAIACVPNVHTGALSYSI